MKSDKFFRNLIIVLTLALLTLIFYQASSLLTPLLSAMVVAYILYPLINFSNRVGIPKGVTIFAILVFIFLTSVGIIFSVIPSIHDEMVALTSQSTIKPESHLIKVYNSLSDQLAGFGILNDPTSPEEVIEKLQEWQEENKNIFLNLLGAVRQTGEFFMVFMFILVFLLLDGNKLYMSLVNLLPNSFFEPGLLILRKTSDVLGYYLRGLVIENLILGLISFLLLLIAMSFTPLTVTLCFLISLAIALTNVIRIVGPFIGGAIGVFIVLMTNPDLLAMGSVFFVVLIVQFLDNVLVLPLVMKDQVNVHPVFCLLSVLMGGKIAGILGMMLAIPFIGAIKVVYRILTVEMKKFRID